MSSLLTKLNLFSRITGTYWAGTDRTTPRLLKTIRKLALPKQMRCVVHQFSDHGKSNVKVKVWVLVIALLTRLEQQRFTISKVAADWHELMIPRRIMRPSIARDSGQLDPRCSTTDIPPPQSATLGLHPVARKLLLISRPAEGRRLSWPEHTIG